MRTQLAGTLAAVLVAGLMSGCGGGSSKPDGSDARGDATSSDGAPDTSDAAAVGDAVAGDAATCTPSCAADKACVGGACLPAPVLLARAPGCGLAHLALSGANVVWTERATGFVKSLPVASPGGAPTIVAMNQKLPGPVSADDTAVYWSNDGDLSIMKAPLAGTPPAPLLTAPDVVNGLLASGGTVYYGAGPSAYKVSSAGGASTTLATFPACKPSKPVTLALDVDHLYQTDVNILSLTRERIDGTQSAKTCVTDGGAPTANVPDTISHSQGELLLDALAVAGGNVVWADSSNLTVKPVGGDATVGANVIAYTAAANAITGFVVSGASVYLGEGDSEGNPGGDAIEVAPLDPGDAGETQATVLATGQPNPSQLVADATHVYWITRTPSATGADDDCAIMTLAK